MKRAPASSIAGDSRPGSREAARARASEPRRSRQQSGGRDPLARAHDALRIAAARLLRSARSIEAGQRLFAIRRIENARHWRAVRRLARVRHWLDSAGNRLFEVGAVMQRATLQATYYYDETGSGASRGMGPVMCELLELVHRAMELELRFEAINVCFREERQPGGLLAGPDAFDKGLVPLAPDVLRRLRGDEAKPVTHQPYRQPVAISATAFRRVTRGRAPPALPLPTL